MHELSIALSLVEEAQKIALMNKAKRIKTLTIEIGSLSGVDKDALFFAFPEATRESLLENAILIVNEIPISVLCQDCKKVSKLESIPLYCPECMNTRVILKDGNQLKMIAMEVE